MFSNTSVAVCLFPSSLLQVTSRNRFNRTFKETLSRLIQNQPDQWENHVGDTLAAHRISVSSVTGYSPFYLLYGRQPRAPLSRLLQASTQMAPFGNRLDNLAQALSVAHRNTVGYRVHNQERLAKRADAKQIHVGDTVVLIASEPLTFTSKWDPSSGKLHVFQALLVTSETKFRVRTKLFKGTMSKLLIPV